MCFNCNKKGHKAKDCKSAKKDEKKKYCAVHGNCAHSTEECRKRKSDSGGDENQKKKGHFDDEFEDYHRMLSAEDHSDDDGKYLTLDSGATAHVIPQSTADSVRDADLTDTTSGLIRSVAPGR